MLACCLHVFYILFNTFISFSISVKYDFYFYPLYSLLSLLSLLSFLSFAASKSVWTSEIFFLQFIFQFWQFVLHLLFFPLIFCVCASVHFNYNLISLTWPFSFLISHIWMNGIFPVQPLVKWSGRECGKYKSSSGFSIQMLSLLLQQSWVVSLQYGAANSIPFKLIVLHFLYPQRGCLPSPFSEILAVFPWAREPPSPYPPFPVPTFQGEHLPVVSYFTWDRPHLWSLDLPYSYSMLGIILQTFCSYYVHFAPITYKLFWP